MTEIVKASTQEVDAFDGFTDAIEGEEERRPQQGAFVKFTNEATWTVNGEVIPATREFVIVDVQRCVVKWPPNIDDGPPVEKIFLAPGQRYPDVEKMNAETPRAEWRKGPDGNMRGPWQAQHITCLLDPKTMDRFLYPTSTVGGNIAVRDIVDKTKWMRRLKGEAVFPLVTLSDVFMNTRFGGRQRPHFEVVKFVAFGGLEGGPTALPAADKPITTEIKPPTAKEATGDTIPF